VAFPDVYYLQSNVTAFERARGEVSAKSGSRKKIQKNAKSQYITSYLNNYPKQKTII